MGSMEMAEAGGAAQALLDIGEVAARSGMAPSALRFYEHEQIIASVDRKGLRRQFPPDVLTTLAVVAMCRRAGFSLEEIKRVLATGGRPSWKAFAARKRDELRAQAAHLDAIADQLDHALRCPSPNVFDCEHFRAALDDVLPVRDETGSGSGSGLEGAARRGR
jgi:DNA-binding transcriptional MerR regulator